jgi:23S rRNA (adenine2503-C2)-methyltransferase
MQPPDPRTLPPDAFQECVAAIGGTAAEAQRLLCHVVRRGHDTPAGVRGVRREVRDALPWPLPRLRLLEERCSAVYPFRKLAFGTHDDRVVESVLIPIRGGRYSLCISSQVGCRRGCRVCATARMPDPRNLETWEIIDQAVQGVARAPGPVRSIVFLGMGEPFDNYDAVLAAAEILSHPAAGLAAATNISIGTAGVVPAIHRYARERRRFRLVVSLGSAVPERRRRLMPIEREHPLEELADAVRAVHAAQRVRQAIALTLLAGFNTDDAEIDALGRWLPDVPYRLSLIDVSPGPHHPYRPPDEAEFAAFLARYRRLGRPFVHRLSGGADIDAACGMLAGNRSAEPTA